MGATKPGVARLYMRHLMQTTTRVIELLDPTLFCQACHIAGRWVEAGEGASIEVDNPATGEIIGVVPSLGASEARSAVSAAARALPSWRATTGKERAAVLRRWFELVIANQEDLARIMTAEQGKPLAESRGEVGYAASFLEWFGEEAKRAYGDTIPGPQRDKRILVLKQPIGVVACITPWNFPLAMITRKASPAIAAGCTVVLKPAAQTPFSALALAELGQRAGLPDGVFNVVTGAADEIGRELTSNPDVRKLSFTGSTATGRLLMRQCAATIKKVSLELGGNAPFIVFEDADLEAAVDGLIAAKYRNSGQTCVCPNRVFVHDRVYTAFVARLTEAVRALTPAPGVEPGATQGPLIDDRAVQKVEEHIGDAVAKGARIVCGGRRHARGGRFFEPTVLVDVDSSMLVAREETFGPLAPLWRFCTEEEVIASANDTPYGLAAYFYSRDLGRVWRVAEALQVGMVGVNTGVISTEVAPFGGVKESGLGREGSKYGIEEFLEIKYVSLGGV